MEIPTIEYLNLIILAIAIISSFKFYKYWTLYQKESATVVELDKLLSKTSSVSEDGTFWVEENGDILLRMRLHKDAFVIERINKNSNSVRRLHEEKIPYNLSIAWFDTLHNAGITKYDSILHKLSENPPIEQNKGASEEEVYEAYQDGYREAYRQIIRDLAENGVANNVARENKRPTMTKSEKRGSDDGNKIFSNLSNNSAFRSDHKKGNMQIK